MTAFLTSLVVLISATALTTYVATRAWNVRPARLFVAVYLSLSAVNLGTFFRSRPDGGALADLGQLLTLPGLAALSWSLLLLVSSLFAPRWWEATRPIRLIS